MKNIYILYIIGFCLALFISCSKEENYKIPMDENGKAIINGISTTTSEGISSLDNEFTVNGTFPNAASGDVMTAECLQEQGGLLLPLAGSQKQITVDGNLKASVTFTRSEANLINVGDNVTVTFAGKTDAGIHEITMVSATSLSGPQLLGNDIDLMRIPDTAFFLVQVDTKTFDYSDPIIVKRKNGMNASWINVGSYSKSENIPVSGSQFADGEDTMYYSFVTQHEQYQDEIKKIIVVRESQFLKQGSATLMIEPLSESGRNLLTHSPVDKDSASAMITIGEDLLLQGGSEWLAQGNSIEFVSSSQDMFEDNNIINAKTVFEEGVSTTSINPTGDDQKVYIFKIVNGVEPEEIYFGVLKITEINLDVSISFDYRIGDQYVHLSKIE